MMLKTLLVMMYFVNTLSFEYAQYSYRIIISPAKTRRGAITQAASYTICSRKAMKLSKLKGSVKEPNISIYFFFPPITQWCSISDVLFTGGRGVSDFSVLKYY